MVTALMLTAYAIFATLEGLLLLRFILRLISADPFHSFVAWLYNTTALIVAPFELMFPSTTSSDGSVLELSTLVAMVGFLFIFYLTIAIFRLFVPDEQVVDPDGSYDS